MFPAGMDSGHDNSMPGGTFMIRTDFFWPHGGSRVFLCGSFTGWSKYIQMSPWDGSPCVFHVACNLAPGSHQYKFNVDGEWRHDDNQPSISASYGVVNTIYLARDTDMVSAANAENPWTLNMDVDDTTFIPMATLTDGTACDLSSRVSGADVDVSRSRISVFLSQHNAYELLPESGKVVALDVNLPVKQAFHILYEQGVPTAPLWDSIKGQFVGVLSAIDFILIMRELGTNGSNLTEEELESHTILAWKDGKLRMNNGNLNQKELVHAGPFDSLKDVAIKSLHNRVSSVPIIHSSDGATPQLLHLATLSGILKCICRHFKHSASSLPFLQQPICSIPLGTWVPKIGEPNDRPFAMLRPHASLGAALSLLVQAEVSSVPIVDDNHSLIDTYSRSDITSFAKDRAYARIRLDEMSIHQALQLKHDASSLNDGSSHGIFNGPTCQMCLPSDTLHKVMERLANPGVRRLVIVEAGSKRVQGILTLSDMFRFLLG